MHIISRVRDDAWELKLLPLSRHTSPLYIYILAIVSVIMQEFYIVLNFFLYQRLGDQKFSNCWISKERDMIYNFI